MDRPGRRRDEVRTSPSIGVPGHAPIASMLIVVVIIAPSAQFRKRPSGGGIHRISSIIDPMDPAWESRFRRLLQQGRYGAVKLFGSHAVQGSSWHFTRTIRGSESGKTNCAEDEDGGFPAWAEVAPGLCLTARPVSGKF